MILVHRHTANRMVQVESIQQLQSVLQAAIQILNHTHTHTHTQRHHNHTVHQPKRMHLFHTHIRHHHKAMALHPNHTQLHRKATVRHHSLIQRHHRATVLQAIANQLKMVVLFQVNHLAVHHQPAHMHPIIAVIRALAHKICHTQADGRVIKVLTATDHLHRVCIYLNRNRLTFKSRFEFKIISTMCFFSDFNFFFSLQAQSVKVQPQAMNQDMIILDHRTVCLIEPLSDTITKYRNNFVKWRFCKQRIFAIASFVNCPLYARVILILYSSSIISTSSIYLSLTIAISLSLFLFYHYLYIISFVLLEIDSHPNVIYSFQFTIFLVRRCQNGNQHVHQEKKYIIMYKYGFAATLITECTVFNL